MLEPRRWTNYVRQWESRCRFDLDIGRMPKNFRGEFLARRNVVLILYAECFLNGIARENSIDIFSTCANS
jgi:hypothetical protein